MSNPPQQQAASSQPLIVRELGLAPYAAIWDAMQRFTDQRDDATEDEIWLVQHPPVFTQGTAGKPEHVLNAGAIPVVQTDRGGQVTYHGPGQLVAYLLVNLTRRKIGVREFVTRIEQAVIDLLAAESLNARGDRAAPGVYLGEQKIASIGLRVRRGCSYHGLSLNVDMDLEPFSRINPCGYANLQVTHMQAHIPDVTIDRVGQQLIEHLSRLMGYNGAHISSAHDVNEGSP